MGCEFCSAGNKCNVGSLEICLMNASYLKPPKQWMLVFDPKLSPEGHFSSPPFSGKVLHTFRL